MQVLHLFIFTVNPRNIFVDYCLIMLLSTVYLFRCLLYPYSLVKVEFTIFINSKKLISWNKEKVGNSGNSLQLRSSHVLQFSLIHLRNAFKCSRIGTSDSLLTITSLVQ